MACILLVEDDDDVAMLLVEVLQGLGHEVHHEGTGTAALAAIEAGHRPGLVITDMVLPGGLGGLELAGELRARWPEVPVVVATGHSEWAAELRASGLRVLCKPFRAADLEAIVRDAVVA
jgi:CheY-like chemotaxis protein